MKKMIFSITVAIAIVAPLTLRSQSKPASATYITKEEVDKVNAVQGVDRTIRVVDIGGEHFAVGIIHRGARRRSGPGRSRRRSWTRNRSRCRLRPIDFDPSSFRRCQWDDLS